MSSENFTKLQLVQNHAARLVKKASKRDSAMSIMFELHWLPIKFRVSFKIALIVFKCLHVDNFPSYVKDLISLYTPSRTLRSSDTFLLTKPRMKLHTFGDKAFSYAAPEVWNELQPEIRFITPLPIFKKQLKTYYFKKAFYD